MESYSYPISSSSSSSSPFSTYPQQQIEQKKNKVLPSYYSSLHGVRRHPTKPITKQPIAPLPPTPPKIYKVAPINFKEVVQMLTSAPEFQSSSSSSSGSSSSSSTRRLRDVAPPALDLSPVSLSSRNGGNNNNNNNDIAAQWREFLRPCSDQLETITTDQVTQGRTQVMPRIPSENNFFGSCSPLANFPLSPASFAWCSSILLSPGALPSPNAVQLI